MIAKKKQQPEATAAESIRCAICRGHDVGHRVLGRSEEAVG